MTQASQEILHDMEQVPAAEVEELLEYKEDTAGGMMNTQFIALHEDATVQDAMEAMQGNENLLASLTKVFLIDAEGKLTAAVAVARLFIATPGTPLKQWAFRETVQVGRDTDRERVVELFDKYNLFTLPVVDEEGQLSGVITADDVISVLTPEN